MKEMTDVLSMYLEFWTGTLIQYALYHSDGELIYGIYCNVLAVSNIQAI